MRNNFKILLTGGCGFIGSAFIHRVLKDPLFKNFNLINIDSLTYAADIKNTSEFENSNRYYHYNVDICDNEAVSKIILETQPDTIINFAAESHVDNSIEKPDIFLKTNIVGLSSLLKATSLYFNNLSEKKKKDFLFIHISTDEVFGDLNDNQSASIENDIYNPSSPYSASKAGSDLLLMAWHRTYGLPCVLTNCSNNYGPRQNTEKLIPKTIYNALNQIKIPIYGDGRNVRDWIFVDDHIDCILKIIEKKPKQFERYNIGGENQISNISLVHKILDRIKNKTQLAEIEGLIEFVDDRPGHDFRYEIDITKAKNHLGWKPKTIFNEGLDLTIDWYINEQL